jgi:hypothetical protein
MENPGTEYSRNNNRDSRKETAKYDNAPAARNESVKTPGNESFEHAQNDPNPHIGSDALAEKYNINDKANHDSSAKDFVRTVSNFNHSGSTADNSENDTLNDALNHS